jgi:hypothetical protein
MCSQFEKASQTALSYTHYELNGLSNSTEAMAHILQVYATTTSSTPGVLDWPYVTLPSHLYEELVHHMISMSHSKVSWTSPLVVNATGWEEYARTHNAPNSSSTMYAYGGTSGHDTSHKEHRMGKEPVSGAGPYTPIHQLFPNPPPTIDSIKGSMINFDTSSDTAIRSTITSVNTFRQSVLSGILPLTLLREAYPESLDATEPLSLFMEPIHIDGEFDVATISYIQSLFEWEYFFTNIPVEGVLCFVEDTCGDRFGYMLNGNNVTYVSAEDTQEIIMEGSSVSSIIGLIDNSDDGVKAAVEAGVCVYTMTIYPTIYFRRSFNSHAGGYTAVVAITMFIMVGTFFAYD